MINLTEFTMNKGGKDHHHKNPKAIKEEEMIVGVVVEIENTTHSIKKNQKINTVEVLAEEENLQENDKKILKQI